MPVYVDYDSADVWANTHIFQIDNQTLLPTAVSGFSLSIEIQQVQLLFFSFRFSICCSAEGQN